MAVIDIPDPNPNNAYGNNGQVNVAYGKRIAQRLNRRFTLNINPNERNSQVLESDTEVQYLLGTDLGQLSIPWLSWMTDNSEYLDGASYYDVLAGLGVSSFADSIGIPSGINLFELETGSSSIDGHGNPSDFGVSVISGDGTPLNDHIQIGVVSGGSGGSARISPYDQSFYLSKHFNPSLDSDADTFANLTIESLTLNHDSETNTSYGIGDILMNAAPMQTAEYGMGGTSWSTEGSSGSAGLGGFFATDESGNSVSVTTEAISIAMAGGGGFNLDATATAGLTLSTLPINIAGQDYLIIGCIAP